MTRVLFAGLLLAFLAAPAYAQAYATGPVNDEETGDVVLQGGGHSPFSGRQHQWQATHNPFTGRLERRSVTAHPNSNRIRAKVMEYDPSSGTYNARSVVGDPATGQTLQASSTQNPFTGTQSQVVGYTNPFNGQRQGIYRSVQQDPYSGVIRRESGQYQHFPGAPPIYSVNTTYYNPYTGVFWVAPSSIRIGY